MSRLKHETVCATRTNGEMGAMGWKHDGDYQADGAGADRGTHLFGRGVRHLLRCRVAQLPMSSSASSLSSWPSVPMRSSGPALSYHSRRARPRLRTRKIRLVKIAQRHRRAGWVFGDYSCEGVFFARRKTNFRCGPRERFRAPQAAATCRRSSIRASNFLAAPRMMLRIRLTCLASSRFSAKISGFTT